MKCLILLFMVSVSIASNVEQANSELGMILVEGGSFTMGNEEGKRNERPEHDVTVSPFYMAKELYTEDGGCNFYNWVLGAMKCNEISKKYGLDTVYSYSSYRHVDEEKKVTKYANASQNSKYTEVKHIYYHELKDCKVDLTKNGFRMPTEAEWEYAVKNGVFDVENRIPSGCDRTKTALEMCTDYFDAKYYKKSPEKDPANLEFSEKGGALDKVLGMGAKSKPRPIRSVRGYKNSETRRSSADGEYTTCNGQYPDDLLPEMSSKKLNRYFLRLVRNTEIDD